MAKISGMEEDKTKGLFTTNLGSYLEKKAKDFNVKLSNSAPENRKKQMNWFVKSSVSDAAKKSGLDLKVQSFLEDNASKKIEKELEGFAARMGKTIETLSESQIIEFKDTELPNIVSSVIDDEVSIDEFKAELEKGIDRRAPSVFDGMTPEFETKFRAKLETRLENLESVEKIDDKYVVTNDQVDEEQMQQIIQTTMKETMDEEFKLDKANKTEIEKKEKEIIENLSATLSLDKEEVAEIVKGGTKKAKDKEVQLIVDNIFKEKPGEEEAVIVEDKVFGTDKKKEEIVKSQAEDDKKVAPLAETEQKVEKPQEASQNRAQAQQAKTNNLAEAELIKKLKQQEAENKKLQSQMKAMEVKLKSATQSNAKSQEIDKKAKAEAEQEVKALEQKDKAANGENKKEQKGEITQLTQDEAKKLSEELKEGKTISSEDAKKVEYLLQKEQEIHCLVKKAEIESNKKEALYKSELEKATRILKAKDMVIEKAKESIQTIVGKKEGEMKELIKQVEELNQRLNNDETTKLRAQVKSLMSDNESLGRSAQMYKNKLDSFSKSKKANEKADNSAALTEEVRQLKGLKNQMENKMNTLTKENRSLDDRYNKLKEMETKYRTESTSLKATVKDLEYKLKSAKENGSRLAGMAEKVKNQGDSGQSSKEIEMLKTQNGQLQAKLKELTEKLRSGGGVGARASNQSAKEKHLEKTNKMLQAEITKARGELDNTKKELMKMKGESTSLKNKMKALEREVDKHKKAA